MALFLDVSDEGLQPCQSICTLLRQNLPEAEDDVLAVVLA